MEQKAQISLEYLLTLLFSIVLVIAAFILLDALRVVAAAAKVAIKDNVEQTIASVIGG